jgi:hypothetical protein
MVSEYSVPMRNVVASLRIKLGLGQVVVFVTRSMFKP